MSTTRNPINWRGRTLLSLDTNEGYDGQQDAYLRLRRIDSHEHLWVNIPSNLSTAGQLFKDHGQHVGSARSLSPDGVFARALLEWPVTSSAPLVQLAHVNGDSACTANGVDALAVSNAAQCIDLGLPEANAIDVQFVLLSKAAASQWSAGPVVPWSASALWSVGIAVRASSK